MKGKKISEIHFELALHKDNFLKTREKFSKTRDLKGKDYR